MPDPILIFVEQRNGQIRRSSMEAVSEGKRLASKTGGSTAAVIVGKDSERLAAEAGSYGADTVYVCADPQLDRYSPEGYALVIRHVAEQIHPSAIFFSASSMGKDLAPTVAAQFQTTALVDCTELRVENQRILARRPVFAGKAFVTLAARKHPAVISLRPNVFAADGPKTGAACRIEKLSVPLPADRLRTAVKETAVTAAGKVDLTEAGIVVSGGRGLKGPEHFALVEKLAEVLGAAVGASRAVVDAGWRPHAEQVGQTGKTVSPNLYIACGISGAIQHLAGMSSSKIIVAINKDPEAPIFKAASYGIVGDVFEILPALTEQLKKTLGK